MPLPHRIVWEALADLASHDEWMKDAQRIVFVTDQHMGVGTRMEVETTVGPFRTVDEMTVVAWDEGRSIEVVHTGLVTGRGTLSASRRGQDTLVTWDEVIRFPWWLGGRLTSTLAKPVLGRIWRGNLRRLEESLSSP